MDALPHALLEHLAAILPEERLEAARAAAESGVRRIAVRVNTLRATRPEVLTALATAGVHARAVDWLPDALVVESGSMDALQESPAFAAGHIYIQSLASIAVSHVLAPEPGQRALDMCAAPGSKASHIAALLRNTGTLYAADASRARIFRLVAVLDRMGANAHTHVERAERWGRRMPGSFDRVLVDAPCSGEGRALAGDAAAAADWSPRKCRRLASEQKSILHSAIEACAPGGIVVYSTCTLGVQENELVLERALQLYAGRVALEPLGVDIPGALPALAEWDGDALPPELQHARRIAPLHASAHPDGPWLEGFFIARLRKLA